MQCAVSKPNCVQTKDMDLFQKFHILPTHASLTEFQQAMRSGRVVQYDLEHLGTEEVGEAIVGSVHSGAWLWAGEGRGRGGVVSRRSIVARGIAVTLSDLEMLIIIDGIYVVVVMGGHIPCDQGHNQLQVITPFSGARVE